MLGNLNDFFIFIDWFHYTHKKMFNVHLTILHNQNLEHCRKVCCRILSFYRLITSKHSTHTHTHTHHDTRRSPHDFLFLSFPGPFFRGPIFRGPFFPGTVFPGTVFPGLIFIVNRHKLFFISGWILSMPWIFDTGFQAFCLEFTRD